MQGPEFRWYNRSGHDLQLPVVEEVKSGKKFVVPEAIPPNILDVKCTVEKERLELTWSRITGDVMLQGETAFRLDPFTGTISGTPSIRFSSLEASSLLGRAEVNIKCEVALGGGMEIFLAVLKF